MEVDTCLNLHIDHAYLDGGALHMVIIPALVDFDPTDDPHAMFLNLKPSSSWWRQLAKDVWGYLISPLSLVRMIFAGNHGKDDNNPLHKRTGKDMVKRQVSIEASTRNADIYRLIFLRSLLQYSQ